MEKLADRIIVLGAVAPSVGRSKRSDYSAIITAFLDSASKQIYVVGADIGRWDLKTLVERICIHHKIHDYSGFVYESNAAQKWLGDALTVELNWIL